MCTRNENKTHLQITKAQHTSFILLTLLFSVYKSLALYILRTWMYIFFLHSPSLLFFTILLVRAHGVISSKPSYCLFFKRVYRTSCVTYYTSHALQRCNDFLMIHCWLLKFYVSSSIFSVYNWYRCWKTVNISSLIIARFEVNRKEMKVMIINYVNKKLENSLLLDLT